MNENEQEFAQTNILVCTVGSSDQPVIKSIDAHKPERVVFVASQTSVEQIEKIRQKIVWNGIKDTQTITVSNHQNLLDCVWEMRKGLREYLHSRNLPDGTLLLADITGGTKIMSSALTLVMMEFQSRFSYVGGTKRNKGGLGTVEDGYETVLQMDNPWDEMGLMETHKLVQSFNSGQFAAALETVEFLRDRNTSFSDFYSGIAKIVAAFMDWDIFRFDTKQFDSGIGILQAYNNRHYPAFQIFFRQLQEFKATFEAIKNETKMLGQKLSAPLEQNAGRLFLIDLVSNAKRRADFGHYDDAVARLYSAVEKTAKIALGQLGKDNSRLSSQDLEEAGEDFSERYARMIDEKGYAQLPLFESYRYLCALDRGNPVAEAFIRHEEDLKKTLQDRNNSLLAHGYKPIAQKDYEKLFNIALEFLRLEEKDLVEFPKMDVNALLF